ncbi:MAG: 3'-5' exonuclease [Nautilia sp.]|nr:MAG: 3'-5' exonuclease [Nautilia sp.]
MKFIILDTETTGTKEEDRIIQLSFLVTDENNEIEEIHNTLCKAPLPISYEAMAVHHITPEKIENELPLNKTLAWRRLNELNKNENILVIHNAKFDIEMLFKEDFENNMQIIDTFRCVKHLWPDGRHSLQINRYSLGLYKKEQALIEKYNIEINAHDALGDVIVLKLLLDYLLEEHSAEELIKLTKEPILYEKFFFGKYKYEKIADVIQKDMGYIEYLLNNGEKELDFDMRYSINYYLQEVEPIYKFEVGKYKGLTPEEVLEQGDIDYLRWAYHNMRMTKGLREQIEKLI